MQKFFNNNRIEYVYFKGVSKENIDTSVNMYTPIFKHNLDKDSMWNFI